MLVSGTMEPMLPNDAELIPLLELAADLRTECATLGALIGQESRLALGPLLRAMNSYYTNKIEGQHTYPADLETAMARKFSDDQEIQRRQTLALAHMELEAELEQEARSAAWNTLFSPAWITGLHARLYQRLDESSRVICDAQGTPRGIMQPGALRGPQEWVKVGDHQAPDPAHVPELLEHLRFRYGAEHLRPTTRLVVAGAALHRLAWIHPFPDGNGRVSRLHNHVLLSQLGLTEGLWSPMRGLARGQQAYYAALHQADLPRRNDTDGRGALSSRGLADFIRFWLDICLDQVRFMGASLALDTLQSRYISLALQVLYDYGRDQHRTPRTTLEPQALGKALYQLFRQGRMERGSFKSMLNTSDRSASRIVSTLTEQGLVRSASRVASLEPGLPFFSLRFLFPGLWPEAEGVALPLARPRPMAE